VNEVSSGGAGKHEPWRRCIGCGRRKLQVELVRLTLDTERSPAQVVPAEGRQHNGRGAYLCQRQVCLDRAVQRKAFQRAFRKTVAVDVDGIAAVIMTEAQ
jgi:predicted RNA-binding protein YlxR (DUF448 family)